MAKNGQKWPKMAKNHGFLAYFFKKSHFFDKKIKFGDDLAMIPKNYNI